MLTGAEAGITRDAIALDFIWRGQQIRLVDTAGLRRQARIDGKIEALAAADLRRAIKYAQVVVLVLDAGRYAGKTRFIHCAPRYRRGACDGVGSE